MISLIIAAPALEPATTAPASKRARIAACAGLSSSAPVRRLWSPPVKKKPLHPSICARMRGSRLLRLWFASVMSTATASAP